MSNKTILYLDASAFKESICLQRLKHIVVDGLREKHSSSALTYGTAFHKFRATLRTTTDFNKAIQDAVTYYAPISSTLDDKDFRTLEHLMATCGGYYKQVYEKDTFNALKYEKDGVETTLIEQKFSFPVYEDDELVVMLCGTVDEVGIWTTTKEVCIADCKTSSNMREIDNALKLFRKSTQLMFYKYVVEKTLPQFKNLRVFIDGIFLGGKEKTKYQRSEIFEPTKEDMIRFEDTLEQCINDIVMYWKSKFSTWPKEFRACDSSRYSADKVGACKFFGFCSVDDEELKQFYIEKNFIQKQYNPLLFDEEKN